MIDPVMIGRYARQSKLSGAAIHIVSVDSPGSGCVVDAGRSIYPASMMKTPLAVAVAQAVAMGRIHWTDELAVATQNVTANDAPSPLVPGATASVREIVELMVGRSDNVATNMALDCVGRDRATADIVALGFPATAFHRKLSGSLPLIDDSEASGRNTHPASEACDLFARIARDEVPGAAFIRGVLANQYWNTKLSRGLEPGDGFAHKTGDTDEVSHDGGILTLDSGERFAIAVYTSLASNDETDDRFAAFMRALRPALRRSG